jgi:hypothetical protein
MNRRDLLRVSAVAGLAGVGLATVGGFPAAAAGVTAPRPAKHPVQPSGDRQITYSQWSSDTDLASGTFAGLWSSGGELRISQPIGQLTYTDPFKGTTGTYDYGTWTSPWTTVGFAADEAISSWTADTPTGTWIQMELRGVTAAGTTTKWYVMGRWAADDDTISRTSLNGQGDTDGTVYTDTFSAVAGHGLTLIQLRVTLYRPVGATTTPDVRSLGFVASTLPDTAATTTPRMAQGIVLPVPKYSQQIHADQYPQWGGGGEAWCSPTSSSMIIAYWQKGPQPADYAWVDPTYPDPWIDYAARNCFDYTYDGTGNWPFNSAYAGRFGLNGFITRLRSLNEAEMFIQYGIPLAMSLSFAKNQIPGLNYSTGGHLVALVGFDATGQPVLNDPNSASDDEVQKPVGRPEFEQAWLNTSGGTVYVMYPDGKALPPPIPGQPNW